MVRRVGRRLYQVLLASLLMLAGLGVFITPTQATIRVGDSEIQVVYEMQHAFQFDGDPTAGMEWVQWRNEPRNESAGVFRGADQEHYDVQTQAAIDRAIAEGKTGSQIPTHPHTDGQGNPCAEGAESFCPSPRTRIRRVKSGSSVFRSMIGFDLIQSFSSLPGMGWARDLPGGIGSQQTFYTFQALTTYQNNNRPSNLNAVTNAAQDRHQRWEQLYTFGMSGFYFRGKLEPLVAAAYSVNAKQPLILAQTYWHGLFFRNLDLFAGMTLYPGSINDVDATGLHLWADRDSFWIRLQYYLL